MDVDIERGRSGSGSGSGSGVVEEEVGVVEGWVGVDDVGGGRGGRIWDSDIWEGGSLEDGRRWWEGLLEDMSRFLCC